MESNYGFLSFLTGSGGFIGNVFAKVKFRCLLAAMIGRFEFSQDGKREVAVKAKVTLKPQRGIPVSVRESVWVWIFRLSRAYCLLPRDGGKLEGRKGCMESCAVTRRLLLYDKTCG